MEPGTKLGTFEIINLLGKGGMGEVYRARDSKLGRDVAIKVLPESFASDPERLARFEREAQTLASLNHPNVATVHGFEHDTDQGVHYLVMEHIDGETLGERIAGGALSVSDALPLFIDIAHGLDAAHEAGIVHRDLKPDNVKINEEGVVKILDFGIAKSAGESQPHDPKASTTPMSPIAVTAEGTFLGTPVYMSPEQARGKTVDKRTDIWAFGCCLFEALTGKLPFEGDTVADTVGAILEREPDWDELPTATPDAVRKLLQRCLEKESRRRLSSAGDIAIALEDIQEGLKRDSQSGKAFSTPHTEKRVPVWVMGIIVLLVVIVGAVLMLAPSDSAWRMTRPDPTSSRSGELANAVPEAKPVRRFSIGLSPEYPIKRPNPVIGDNPLALSPDGKTLVYVSESGGKTQLIARQLDQLEARPIPGSEYAWSPFFSPDGLWVGYQQRGNEHPKLMKIPVKGGVPVPLADSEFPFGGSWGDDGNIVFGWSLGSGIWRVSAEGGTAEMITTLDREAGESLHAYPQVVQGGDAMLVMVGLIPPDADHGRITIRNSETKDLRIIADDVGRALYVPSGHIVYARAGELLAIPFDLDTFEVSGSEVPVTESRMAVPGAFPRSFTFSAEGTMVYIPLDKDTGEARTLVWVDRQGNEEPIALPVRPYSSVRISPDGTRLAVDHLDLENVWVCDLNRGSTQRLTFAEGSNYRPIWAVNGEQIIFLRGMNLPPFTLSGPTVSEIRSRS